MRGDGETNLRDDYATKTLNRDFQVLIGMITN